MEKVLEVEVDFVFSKFEIFELLGAFFLDVVREFKIMNIFFCYKIKCVFVV